MSQSNELITNFNGYLLHFTVKNLDFSLHIQLNQYKYDVVRRSFEIFSQDTQNVDVEKRSCSFQFESSKNIIKQQNFLAFSVQIKTSEKSKKLLLVSIQDEKTQSLKFDQKLFTQLNQLTDPQALDLSLFLDPINRMFYFYNLTCINQKLYLKINYKISSNDKIQNKSFLLVDSTPGANMHSFQWKYLTNSDNFSFFNLKTILIFKIQIQNSIYFKTFLIDSFKSVSQLNSQRLFGDYEIFSKNHLNFFLEGSTFLDKDLLFLNKVHNSSFSTDLIDFELLNYKIGLNKQGLYIQGECCLGFDNYLVNLNNGQKKSIFKLENKLDQLEFQSGQLIAKTKKGLHHVFDDSRLIYKSEIDQIIYDYFLTEEESILYVLIRDFQNGDYEIKQSLSSRSELNYSKEKQDEFELNDFANESIDFSMIQAPVQTTTNSTTKSQNCCLELIKILEAKDRTSDLLLKDASNEIRRKLALITELSYFYFIKNSQAENAPTLPKLVELYSSDSKKNLNLSPIFDKSGLKCFTIKQNWSCFLNQTFLINLILLNDSNKVLNSIDCVVLLQIPRDNLKRFLANNLRLKLMILKNSDMFEINGDLKNLIKKEQKQIGPNETVLLTIEMDKYEFNDLMAQYPHGEFQISLFLNSITESNARAEVYKQDIPFSFNLFDKLIMQKENFDSRTYLSLLNHFENGSETSKQKLKFFNISLQDLKEILKNLSFECVLELNKFKSVFYSDKQTFVSDSFLIAEFESQLNCIDLTIFSGNRNQSNAIIKLLKKISSQNCRIELDVNELIDELHKALSQEIDYLISSQNSQENFDFEMEICDETERNTANLLNLSVENLIQNEINSDNAILKIIDQ